MKRVVSVALVVIVLLTSIASALASNETNEFPCVAYTAKKNARVRQYADKESQLITELKSKGTRITVIGSTYNGGEKWYELETDDGKKGFVRSDYLRLEPDEAVTIAFDTPTWDDLHNEADVPAKMFFDEGEAGCSILAGAIAFDLIPEVGSLAVDKNCYAVKLKNSVAVILRGKTDGYMVEIPNKGKCRYIVLEDCSDYKLSLLFDDTGNQVVKVTPDAFQQGMTFIFGRSLE